MTDGFALRCRASSRDTVRNPQENEMTPTPPAVAGFLLLSERLTIAARNPSRHPNESPPQVRRTGTPAADRLPLVAGFRFGLIFALCAAFLVLGYPLIHLTRKTALRGFCAALRGSRNQPARRAETGRDPERMPGQPENRSKLTQNPPKTEQKPRATHPKI